MSLADAYDCASRVIVENMLADDAAEGIRAFLDKRESTEARWMSPVVLCARWVEWGRSASKLRLNVSKRVLR